MGQVRAVEVWGPPSKVQGAKAQDSQRQVHQSHGMALFQKTVPGTTTPTLCRQGVHVTFCHLLGGAQKHPECLATQIFWVCASYRRYTGPVSVLYWSSLAHSVEDPCVSTRLVLFFAVMVVKYTLT